MEALHSAKEARVSSAYRCTYSSSSGLPAHECQHVAAQYTTARPSRARSAFRASGPTGRSTTMLKKSALSYSNLIPFSGKFKNNLFYLGNTVPNFTLARPIAAAHTSPM